mgnify:CR=1 FL=1
MKVELDTYLDGGHLSNTPAIGFNEEQNSPAVVDEATMCGCGEGFKRVRPRL